MSTPAPVFSFDRMTRAVEEAKTRLYKATDVLEGAGIAYAVAGGNAVAAWVATVDESAVRNTPGADILISRADLPHTVGALRSAGFLYRHAAGFDLFFDAEETRARGAVRIGFVEWFARRWDILPEADVLRDAVQIGGCRVMPLDCLVALMLLRALFRDEDRMHLRDLLDVGLIDATWTTKYPAELGARLQQLIDTPEGWEGLDRGTS